MNNDALYENIGRRIRSRKGLGISQEKTAEKFGFTQTKVSRLENGIRVHQD